MLLQDLVARQAERRPDRAAVVTRDRTITYGEFDAWSSRIARALRERGCTAGDRVCLLLPKSDVAIASILGVLKAGAVYVPLDPRSPAARVTKMIRSCEPRAVLACASTAGLLTALSGQGTLGGDTLVGWMERAEEYEPPVPVDLDLDNVHAQAPDAPALSILSSAGPDRLAYILYTSGSTGTPKGVPITHANVLQFVRWATDHFDIRPGERTSGHAPLHFDLSTFDLFGTFAAGATLYPVPRKLNVLPHRLAEWIRATELTQWFSVPSVLSYLAKFDVVGQDDFPALRRVLWCGEVFPTPSLVHWMRRLPHVSFTNLYGPTETTVASSYYTVPSVPSDERAEIPIGRACAGEELLVLDDELNRVPAGAVGHLYIRGVGLSPGYWRDEPATRQVFLPDPFDAEPDARIYQTGDLARLGDDGLVYFVGREGSMIKSRGYRIEPGEVENALHSLDCLEESAVVPLPTDGFEGTAIGCAYTVLPSTEITPRQLRTALADIVPEYMLPTRWLKLQRLPRNANGKIDRRELRERLEATCD